MLSGGRDRECVVFTSLYPVHQISLLVLLTLALLSMRNPPHRCPTMLKCP